MHLIYLQRKMQGQKSALPLALKMWNGICCVSDHKGLLPHCCIVQYSTFKRQGLYHVFQSENLSTIRVNAKHYQENTKDIMVTYCGEVLY